MIIENERDRRTAAWLEEHYTPEELIEAQKRLIGARKAYPSNIAKVLGKTPPERLKYASNEEAQIKLKEIKEMLKGKKWTER